MTATIPNLQAPTFGAICSRCAKPYETLKWTAPFNTHCPSCLIGIARDEAQLTVPFRWADITNTTWGAGS